MADMNSITLTGRLGQDAELRYTAEGTAILSFSLGNGTYKKGAGDYNTLTTWYKVNMFGGRAESVYNLGALVKGARVGVIGVHSMRPWTDNDGNERLSCEVAANEITLLDGRNGSTDNSAGKPAQKPVERSQAASRPTPAPTRNKPAPVTDEDLPF